MTTRDNDHRLTISAGRTEAVYICFVPPSDRVSAPCVHSNCGTMRYLPWCANAQLLTCSQSTSRCQGSSLFHLIITNSTHYSHASIHHQAHPGVAHVHPLHSLLSQLHCHRSPARIAHSMPLEHTKSPALKRALRRRTGIQYWDH